MEEADVIMTAVQDNESDAHKSQKETRAQKRRGGGKEMDETP